MTDNPLYRYDTLILSYLSDKCIQLSQPGYHCLEVDISRSSFSSRRHSSTHFHRPIQRRRPSVSSFSIQKLLCKHIFPRVLQRGSIFSDELSRSLSRCPIHFFGPTSPDALPSESVYSIDSCVFNSQQSNSFDSPDLLSAKSSSSALVSGSDFGLCGNTHLQFIFI